MLSSTVPVNKKVLLRHNPDLSVQRTAGDVPNFAAVDQQFARRWQIKLRNQVGDRCLATAGVSDQGDRLAGPGDESYIFQHRALRIVAEMHVAKFHAAGQSGHIARRGIVLPIGLAIEQIENPLRAGHRRERGVVLISQHRDRREEQIGHEEEPDQIGDMSGRSGMERLISADQEQHGDEELVVQIQQRQEQALGTVHNAVVLGVVAYQVAEHLRVHILPHKALRDAHAVDAFGQRGRDAAERIAHPPQGDAQLEAKVVVDNPQYRRQAEHHQKQQRVVPKHERGGDAHLADLHQAHEQHFLHAHPHVFHVGGHAADDAAELGAMIKTHRHRLQMPENVVPQIEHHRFAQFQGQPLAKVHDDLC